MLSEGLARWMGEVLSHRFSSPDLLVQALTHRSWANEAGETRADNQRLEFLGDAVLGMTVSDYLYRQFPYQSEGELTRLRAAVVTGPVLARRARALGLGERLRLGQGEAASGGRERDSNLADAFEAVVAAIYLDAGMEAARSFVLRQLEPAIREAVAGGARQNHKALLQERLQAEHGETPAYLQLSAEGPAHARRFRMAVTFRGQVLAEGEGRSKKEAEQAAAKHALRRLVER